MKEYEHSSLEVTKILPYRPFLVRLDGRSFSKFTYGLQKPFDLNFTKAMTLTTSDIVQEFSACTGYTHSDEITIIFPISCSEEEFTKNQHKSQHIFDGRVMKILTVMSGFCSTRFNFHLAKIVNNDEKNYKKETLEKINEMRASFDARLLLIPEDNKKEFLNHMIWRSIFDCERNAVSTYARSKFSQKKLTNLNKKDMIELLKTEGINWETDVPIILKHGVFVKKLEYLIDGKDGKKAVRTKVTCKAFKIHFDEFYIKLLFDKYWDVSEENSKLFNIVDIDHEKGFNN